MLSKKTKAQFELLFLFKSKEEKLAFYQNIDCPKKFLEEAAFNLSNSGSLDDIDLQILEALVLHPHLSEESIIKLEEVYTKLQKKDKLAFGDFKQQPNFTAHPNHPTFQKNLIESILNKSNLATNLKDLCGGDIQRYIDLSNSIFLAGNSLCDYINNRHGLVNDYDLFFKNTASAKSFFTFLIDALKPSYPELKDCSIIESSNNISIDGLKSSFKANYNRYELFITQNAISVKGELLPRSLQFIARNIGSPEEVLGLFDFVHCQSYYDIAKDKITFFDRAYWSITKQKLVYNHLSPTPLASLIRLRKFLAKGFQISQNEMIKLAFALQKMNLSDPKTLKDCMTNQYGERFDEIFDREFKGKTSLTLEDIVEYVLFFEESKNLTLKKTNSSIPF